jgi:hypothetical protein
MNTLTDPRWLTAAFVFMVQFVLFLRWLHRRLRNDEITRVFVQDMATNHLPHIYDLLRRLCGQQGIHGTNPPIVHWIDLDNRER